MTRDDQDRQEALYRFFERKLQEADTDINHREINQFGFVLIGVSLAAFLLLIVWLFTINWR
jgi:CRISPR/Cas system CSM-associated protein Csm2 small subunit